ncbi:hypothetical protein [Brevundimonas sp.]|uniref:hypothetical protein n=1 Tax=Brevundimonas sp. TaxID=1871086 RepID=UPI003918DF66
MDDHSHAGLDAGDSARGGYRRASDETWARARRDYEAGHTGVEVCARHDLRPSTLRDRARAEGWRRIDAPTPDHGPEPVDLHSDEALELPDYEEMALVALVRVNRALKAGRAAEAGSWMRLHEKLTALAALPDPEQTPPPPPQSAWADDHNLEARQAAINARFAEMAAEQEARAARNSDNSYNSYTVFSGPPVPSPLEGEGGSAHGCVSIRPCAEGEGASGSERPQAEMRTHTPHPTASGGHLLPQGEKEISPATPPTPSRSPPPAAP